MSIGQETQSIIKPFNPHLIISELNGQRILKVPPIPRIYQGSERPDYRGMSPVSVLTTDNVPNFNGSPVSFADLFYQLHSDVLGLEYPATASRSNNAPPESQLNDIQNFIHQCLEGTLNNGITYR
jgi:hypothetical protein